MRFSMRHPFNKKHYKLVLTLLIMLVYTPANASQWALSFGANDMVVKNARPLEEAPNGDTSHTFGAQVALHGKSNREAAVQQSGYFKIFADKDKDHLDPDHIPIWFLGEYQAKSKLASLSKNSAIKMIFDAEYLSNTVSSIERKTKLFAGISAEYETRAFAASIKTNAGRYALEIDDDVPRIRGYDREGLKNIEIAYSIMADTNIALGEKFNLYMLAQTWQNGDQWLENQLKLQLNYDSNSWQKDSTVVVNITHTEYNLDSYNHADTGAPDYLPILPWTSDTLIQAYIKIPWNF